MQQRIDPRQLIRSPRARLAAAALVTGLLAAGCGGSSPGAAETSGGASSSASTAASAGAPTTSGSTTPTQASTTSPGSTSLTAYGSGPLGFSKCMRGNGVPSFPDPKPGHGALFNTAGIDPSSPAFKAAQAKCQKLMGAGPPVPGSTTHPSAQTLAKLVRIARCMRAHGVPQFPDPQTTVPSNPAGVQEITDFDGAILLFPATMDMQAPAYKQALAACGAPPLGLPH